MNDTELIDRLLNTLTDVSEKVNKLEVTEKQIDELTKQVKELKGAFYDTAKKLEDRIEILENADKTKLWVIWEKAKNIIITIIVTGVVTFLLTKFGFTK